MNQPIKFATLNIAQHFLPAIINGDFTGLDDNEELRLLEWLDTLPPSTIFSPLDTEPYFAEDEVTGLQAQCIKVELFATSTEVIK